MGHEGASGWGVAARDVLEEEGVEDFFGRSGVAGSKVNFGEAHTGSGKEGVARFGGDDVFKDGDGFGGFAGGLEASSEGKLSGGRDGVAGVGGEETVVGGGGEVEGAFLLRLVGEFEDGHGGGWGAGVGVGDFAPGLGGFGTGEEFEGGEVSGFLSLPEPERTDQTEDEDHSAGDQGGFVLFEEGVSGFVENAGFV